MEQRFTRRRQEDGKNAMLVLVRILDTDETAEVARTMREGIDQRKWSEHLKKCAAER